MKSHLVIHHSGTTDSDTLSWAAIRTYHLKKNWVNIGYHLGVEWVDRPGDTPGYYEMMAGRPLLARAAGEPKEGFNRKGIHVCFVGNFDKIRPPIELWQFAMPHLADLLDVLGIPLQNVIGHREIANVGTYKQCPGKLWSMDAFRDMLGGSI
jgi:hypothetical protein